MRGSLDDRKRPVDHVWNAARVEVTILAARPLPPHGSPHHAATALRRRTVAAADAESRRRRDGGSLVLRAHLTVAFAALDPDAPPLPGSADGVLTRRLVVDLFDPPPRVAHLAAVRARAAAGSGVAAIARDLGLTEMLVINVLALARLMDEAGSDDPYQELTTPPEDRPTQLRRHRHPRYRFEPLAPPPGPDAPD